MFWLAQICTPSKRLRPAEGLFGYSVRHVEPLQVLKQKTELSAGSEYKRNRKKNSKKWTVRKDTLSDEEKKECWSLILRQCEHERGIVRVLQNTVDANNSEFQCYFWYFVSKYHCAQTLLSRVNKTNLYDTLWLVKNNLQNVKSAMSPFLIQEHKSLVVWWCGQFYASCCSQSSKIFWQNLHLWVGPSHTGDFCSPIVWLKSSLI